MYTIMYIIFDVCIHKYTLSAGMCGFANNRIHFGWQCNCDRMRGSAASKPTSCTSDPSVRSSCSQMNLPITALTSGNAHTYMHP